MEEWTFNDERMVLHDQYEAGDITREEYLIRLAQVQADEEYNHHIGEW